MEDKGQLRLIDVPAIAEGLVEPYTNVTLCQVNDAVVRLGAFEGDFHWHHHAEEDELFLVLEGEIHIDLPGRTVHLGPHQGFTVPAGTEHRPRAEGRAIVLMVERVGVKQHGD